MRLFALFIAIVLLFSSNTVSAETSPREVLEQYFSLSSRLFPPQLEMNIDERVTLTKEKDSFWSKKMNSAKDFLFIKQNARFSFSIKNIVVKGNTAFYTRQGEFGCCCSNVLVDKWYL